MMTTKICLKTTPLIIGKIGLAMGVELSKIEQISNWIIDHIIWLEQAKVIFEEKE